MCIKMCKRHTVYKENERTLNLLSLVSLYHPMNKTVHIQPSLKAKHLAQVVQKAR